MVITIRKDRGYTAIIAVTIGLLWWAFLQFTIAEFIRAYRDIARNSWRIGS